jgi:hypothetical protein
LSLRQENKLKKKKKKKQELVGAISDCFDERQQLVGKSGD